MKTINCADQDLERQLDEAQQQGITELYIEFQGADLQWYVQLLQERWINQSFTYTNKGIEWQGTPLPLTRRHKILNIREYAKQIARR